MFHIIDDGEIAASLLAQMIGLFGEEATFFLSPVKYLEYAKSPEYQKPIAVFTDVDMPKINGHELIEKTRRIHPETKFVIVSGRPAIEHDEKTCVCVHLCKPFYPDDIEQVIHTLKACSNWQPSPLFGCEKLSDLSLRNSVKWTCPHIKEG